MEKKAKVFSFDQQSLLTPADAVMAVAVLAAGADGKPDERELSGLERALFASPVFAKVKNPVKYRCAIAAAIACKGREATLIEATGLLSPGLRETAYAWATYVIAADRKTVSPEHKFLSLLRRRFGIHGELAGKINAVVSMLHRAK